MFKNFNKLIFESLIDYSNYHFSNDQNGNIFCTFTINDKLVVNAKKFNDKLTFDITDKNGQSSNLSEKQFSVEYNDAYNQFKRKLNAYIASDFENDDIKQSGSKIKNFSDQIKDEQEKDIDFKVKVDGLIFAFKKLNDLMVANYCQCIFQFFDQNENELRGVKSLIVLKQKNSIIIKSIIQNERGETLLTLTQNDFKLNYPDVFQKFKDAIKKFEDYSFN